MLIFIMQNLNLRVLFSHLQKWHVLLGLILISYFVFPIIIMTFDTYNIERFTSDVGFELKHILGKVYGA